MSDLELRTYERAADSPVRELATQLRSGLISFERLQLAARLGDATALAVLGKLDREPFDWKRWDDRRYAIRAVAEAVMGRDAKRLMVAFAADCAERVLPIFEAKHPGDSRPRQAIEAARAWVACPSPAAAAAADADAAAAYAAAADAAYAAAAAAYAAAAAAYAAAADAYAAYAAAYAAAADAAAYAAAAAYAERLAAYALGAAKV